MQTIIRVTSGVLARLADNNNSRSLKETITHKVYITFLIKWYNKVSTGEVIHQVRLRTIGFLWTLV